MRDLTTRRLRRGVFRQVREVITAIIEAHIAHDNTRPRVFTQVVQVEDIQATQSVAPDQSYIRRHLYDTVH